LGASGVFDINSIILAIMKIAVLVLDGVFDTGLAAILDTFAMANSLRGPDLGGERYIVRVVGVGRRVRTAQGLQVPLAGEGRGRPDVVVIPAMGAKMPDEIEERLARPDVRRAGERLRAWRRAGAEIAGACTASFLMASATLLDGRRATTSWWLAPAFRRSFPAVELDEAQMLVQDGGVITAGAALAHVDLALWLIRRRSPELAGVTARYLLLDGRPTQSAYAMTDHLAHADPMVDRFERWTRRNLAGFSLAGAARAVGTSERSLERSIRRVLGRTVISYVQDLRVEQAVHRLETTSASIDEIAVEVGYRDAVTLRTLLRRKTGRGVRELRARAGDRAAGV
jgi:transcriptional regulator GlxA family with amidase domain